MRNFIGGWNVAMKCKIKMNKWGEETVSWFFKWDILPKKDLLKFVQENTGKWIQWMHCPIKGNQRNDHLGDLFEIVNSTKLNV